MDLFTRVEFPEIPIQLDYNSEILFMGSCFAEEVGSYLEKLRFQAMVNPLGISYNPLSIAKHLQRAIDSDFVTNDEISENNGKYFHYDFHGRFNSDSTDKIIGSINEGIRLANEKLRSARFVCITFGTAIVYSLESDQGVVNNCHKMPSKIFNKEFLDVPKMAESFSRQLKRMRELNPNCKILLTVSPIRHLRHGFIENQRSKSRLLLLCEELEKLFEYVFYLPVYELVMDELRDYRFYRQDDLIHLNQGGLDMIRERFLGAFCSKPTLQTVREVEKWLKAKSHRVTNPGSKEHETFESRLKEMTEALEAKYPGRFKL